MHTLVFLAYMVDERWVRARYRTRLRALDSQGAEDLGGAPCVSNKEPKGLIVPGQTVQGTAAQSGEGATLHECAAQSGEGDTLHECGAAHNRAHVHANGGEALRMDARVSAPVHVDQCADRGEALRVTSGVEPMGSCGDICKLYIKG